MEITLLGQPISVAQFLPAAALILAASLIVGRVLLNAFPGKRPPVFEGIPFIGGLLKFSKGPYKLMEAGYAKHGEVFTVPVAHKRVTFLIGNETIPHFFKAPDHEMSQSEVYDFNVPTFGKGVVYDVDQKVRTEQFRFFTEALTKDRLKSYVPQFVKEAEDFFAQWGDSGEVDLKDEFSKLIMLTAARTLLGREVRENLFNEVADLLHDLDAGMLPISVFFPYLPIPAHNKRDQSRDELKRIFSKVIQQRRASGKKEQDVLQAFIDAKYQNVYNGRSTTDDEITGLLIASLFAGQHTSSLTTAWTGYRMTDDKENSYAKAVEEQKAVIAKHGNELSYDILGEMEVLHRNISEALRMCPPLVLVMRYAKQPFSVTTSDGKTYTIPKGDICMVSPSFNHMLPHLFPEPDKYDPERFAPPREEHVKKPFSWLGFGSGRHGCLGQNFAYLQIKSIWSVLLRNFDFEMVTPVPEPDWDSMVIGPKPAKIRYTRRKVPLA